MAGALELLRVSSLPQVVPGTSLVARLAPMRGVYTMSGRQAVVPRERAQDLAAAARLAANGLPWAEIAPEYASALLEPDLRARGASARLAANLLGRESRTALREAAPQDRRAHRSPARWTPKEGETPPRPNIPCPCGSGRRYEKCCRPR